MPLWRIIATLTPIPPRVEPQRHRGTEKTQSHPDRKHEDTKAPQSHLPARQPKWLPHQGKSHPGCLVVRPSRPHVQARRLPHKRSDNLVGKPPRRPRGSQD
jgi:hypothetical protein